jgi:hypothetical protein
MMRQRKSRFKHDENFSCQDVRSKRTRGSETAEREEEIGEPGG